MYTGVKATSVPRKKTEKTNTVTSFKGAKTSNCQTYLDKCEKITCREITGAE